MTDRKRWTVSIIYRGETGAVVVDYEIEELEELQELVERGPDWNSIMDISVQLTNPDTSVFLQSPIQREVP